MTETGGEGEPGRSVLVALHDDNDDDVCMCEYLSAVFHKKE